MYISIDEPLFPIRTHFPIYLLHTKIDRGHKIIWITVHTHTHRNVLRSLCGSLCGIRGKTSHQRRRKEKKGTKRPYQMRKSFCPIRSSRLLHVIRLFAAGNDRQYYLYHLATNSTYFLLTPRLYELPVWDVDGTRSSTSFSSFRQSHLFMRLLSNRILYPLWNIDKNSKRRNGNAFPSSPTDWHIAPCTQPIDHFQSFDRLPLHSEMPIIRTCHFLFPPPFFYYFAFSLAHSSNSFFFLS